MRAIVREVPEMLVGAGTVLTHEEMEMLVDVARQHDLFLIGDEAYREFVYAGEPLQSFGEFTHAAENVILIDTVSKRFSASAASSPATGSSWPTP